VGVEPVLQDFYGGGLINYGPLFGAANASCRKHSGG
jgi:hypothetical protein